jgi:hypothetical protein
MALALGACAAPGAGDGSDPPPAPPAGPTTTAQAPSPADGAPRATRNTVRLGDESEVQDAAAVARAVFPARSRRSRPGAVLLVDSRDWQGGLAAAAMAGRPARAPVLLSEGEGLPPASRDALEALRPTGAGRLGGQRVLRVGRALGRVADPRLRLVPGTDAADPFARAAAVDAFASALAGRPSRDVIVTSGEDPAWAMPAAAWAGRSGDAILLTRRDALPAATRTRLEARRRPAIWILGPRGAVSTRVERELRRLGRVRRVSGPTPVENAVAFARYERGGFGWGIAVPGSSFTVASVARPLDAAAAAALGANGVFAPLLLTDRADPLPPALEAYLLDVQPGYEGDPGDAVFNRVWIVGGEGALSPAAQGRLDEVAALVPVGP